MFSIHRIAAALCAVLLAGCGGYDRGPSDVTAPQVLSTVPYRSANNVAVNSAVSATFSEAMNDASLNANTFVLKDAAGQAVAGSISYQNKTATFVAAATLANSKTYTATVTRYATDLGGNKLAAEHSWTFTTGADADLTPPTVSRVTPVDGAQDVTLDTTINAAFNEPIDGVTLSSANITMRDDAGNTVAGTIEYNGLSVTFAPSRLDAETTYTVTLGTGITDQAGNALAGDYTWRFTTIAAADTLAPLISNTRPGNGATDVAANASLMVTFSEPLDAATVTGDTFLLKDPQGNPVAGTVTYDRATTTFTPTATLSHGATYTATITTAITDVAGNHLALNYNWAFTTGSADDLSAPLVSDVSPINNSVEVANNNAVSATFSEGLDPATITGATFTLSSATSKVDGTVSYGGQTALFRPTQILADSTTYTAKLATGITDLAGNPLAADYSWRFTTGVAPDRDVPTVSSVYPANDAIDVAINSAFLATFSEVMDAGTLTTANVFLTDSTGSRVDGTVLASGATLTFKPGITLAHSASYTATVTTAVKDLAGNRLADAYVWTFTTAAAEDTTPPAVMSTVPASAAGNAAVNRAVSIRFSEPLDAATVNAGTIHIEDAFTNAVAGTVAYVGTTATFTPATALDYATTYTATITNDVKDLAGNPLPANHSWRFTTSTEPDTTPPTVTATAPANGALAAANSVLSVSFSEPMQTTTLSSATFLLQDAAGLPVAGTISANDTNATFTPSTPLAHDTQYTATLTADVRDLASNRLDVGYTWHFTTTPPPELAPPIVVSVLPLNGETNIPIDATITAGFSEPVNCTPSAATAMVVTSASGAVPGTTNCNGSNIVFTPTNALATRTTFTVTANSGISDQQGDTLGSEYTWTFTTAPWTRQLGTPGADQGFAVATDSAGNIFVAGFTQGHLQKENAGGADVLVAKYDSSSRLLWTRQIGSGGDEFAQGVATDSNGDVYVVGYTYGNLAGTSAGESDLFIIKYNGNGEMQWQRQWGAAGDDIASAVAVASTGAVFITGYTMGGLDGDAGNGGYDAFIAKYNATGARAWSRTLGSFDNDIAYGLTTDVNGNALLTGYTAGALYGSNAGSADIFVAAYDTDGNQTLLRQTGSALDEHGRGIVTDAAGNIYVTGYTLGDMDGNINAGGADLFLIKYDATGTWQWTRQLGSGSDDRAYALSMDADANIYLAGYTFANLEGVNAGGYDALLLKYDVDGTRLWTRQYGSATDDFAFGAATAMDGSIYVTGYTAGDLDENVNTGEHDAFVLRYDGSGTRW